MAESKLSTGMSGDQVKALHAQLREQGFEIPASEAEAGLFGPATRKAVRAFQKQHSLKVNGVVDEATAEAIAQTIDAVNTVYVVEGRVASRERPGVGKLPILLPWTPTFDIYRKQYIFPRLSFEDR